VTDLEKAEQKALFILFLENQIGDTGYRPVKDLNVEYQAGIPEHLLESAFLVWVNKGWAKKYNVGVPLSAKLRKASFGEVYKQVLYDLDAKSLKVQAETREIFIDHLPTNDLPMKEGWKWRTYEDNSKEGVEEKQFTKAKNSESVVFPIPPESKIKREVDWPKWSVIIGALSILVVIIIAVVG
tara:strand:+ start:1701 stop:2249 length:549 start_codon:yes stop_codon:yes gene_type:complete